MNNNPRIPLLPPPNQYHPQIIQYIPPPTLRAHPPMYHTPNQYHPQILHRSQSYPYLPHLNIRPHLQQQPRPQPMNHYQHQPSYSNHNQQTKPKQAEESIHPHFCIDKKAYSYNTNKVQPTPHYRVCNELPIPMGQIRSGKIADLRNCFNCGGDHMIRDCKYARDNQCVRFNRHLKDKYDPNKGAKNRMFGRKRYYDNDAKVNEKQPLSRNGSRNASSSNLSSSSLRQSDDSATAAQSFDSYLKMHQDESEHKTQIQRKQSVNNDSKPEEEKNEPQPEQIQLEDSEPCIGFKFCEDIEGLKIFKTTEQIETARDEHEKQLEIDRKDMENMMKNKYKQRKHDSGSSSRRDRDRDRRRDRSRSRDQYNRYHRSNSRYHRRRTDNHDHGRATGAIDYGFELKQKGEKIKKIIRERNSLRYEPVRQRHRYRR